jgi:hypothetical protein
MPVSVPLSRPHSQPASTCLVVVVKPSVHGSLQGLQGLVRLHACGRVGGLAGSTQENNCSDSRNMSSVAKAGKCRLQRPLQPCAVVAHSCKLHPSPRLSAQCLTWLPINCAGCHRLLRTHTHARALAATWTSPITSHGKLNTSSRLPDQWCFGGVAWANTSAGAVPQLRFPTTTTRACTTRACRSTPCTPPAPACPPAQLLAPTWFSMPTWLSIE